MTYVSSLDIYEKLAEKVGSIAMCVSEGELTKEQGADMLVGFAIPDVAMDLDIEIEKVRDIFTGAMCVDSPWYSFYHGFVFPMDKTNRSLEESPPKESKATGYVYIIEDPGSGLCKIGKSTDPGIRLANLNRNLTPMAQPYKLRIRVEVPDYSNVESELHDRYHDKRSRPRNGQGGEWFDLDQDDIDEIFESLVALGKKL